MQKANGLYPFFAIAIDIMVQLIKKMKEYWQHEKQNVQFMKLQISFCQEHPLLHLSYNLCEMNTLKEHHVIKNTMKWFLSGYKL